MPTKAPPHSHRAQDRAVFLGAVSDPMAAFSPATRDGNQALVSLSGSSPPARCAFQARFFGMTPEKACRRIDVSAKGAGLGAALVKTRNRRRGP